MRHDRDRDRDRLKNDDDPTVPGRAANMEEAEGSRDTADEAVGSEVPPAAFDERHNEDMER